MTDVLRKIGWLVVSAVLLTAAVYAAGTPGPAKTDATGTKAKPDKGPFGPPAGGWPADVKPGIHQNVKVDGLDMPEAYFHAWVPKDYTPEKAWPLVIVLHGGPGGHAIDMAAIFAMGYADKGAISLFPQALKQRVEDWDYPDESMYLVRIILQAAKSYHVDPCRIYLLGHSMGGGGTWVQGAVLRDIWAGLGPVSAYWRSNVQPKDDLLAGVPIYCLQGEADKTIPVQCARAAAEAMKKVGHKDFVYRELPGVGHQDILSDPKNKPELGKQADWLLSHKRNKPADLDAAARSLADWAKKFHWVPEGGPLGTYAADKKKEPPAK